MERIAEIEKFITQSGAVIKEDQNRASFVPSHDEINMPPKTLFFDNGQSATENYYAVLLHELTHWTGGKSRLDREQVGHSTDEKKYAFEELIAELGSAFLCSHFRIKQHGRDDHATYIKSWLQALKNDKKFIFKAASQAQKAVDFLHGLASE
ncbi:zincin-like metallopeptidase domain-containing protein [Teredinibacter purpureus]|uniref:zincin-like metallopeptidase domain-containing protein n=1 Tax=Teredinibacter purpureus TaxID=2731756 RepID=UPI00069754CB|nr:zincin-like metallopeptidase domain-containing protein [Teredinibacter purpureus]